MKCSKKFVLDYRSYFQYGEFGCTIISHSDNTALLKNVYIIRPSNITLALLVLQLGGCGAVGIGNHNVLGSTPCSAKTENILWLHGPLGS